MSLYNEDLLRRNSIRKENTYERQFQTVRSPITCAHHRKENGSLRYAALAVSMFCLNDPVGIFYTLYLTWYAIVSHLARHRVAQVGLM